MAIKGHETSGVADRICSGYSGDVSAGQHDVSDLPSLRGILPKSGRKPANHDDPLLEQAAPVPLCVDGWVSPVPDIAAWHVT